MFDMANISIVGKHLDFWEKILLFKKKLIFAQNFDSIEISIVYQKYIFFERKFDFIFPTIHGSLIVKLDYYRLHASLVFLIGVIYIARPQRTRINII